MTSINYNAAANSALRTLQSTNTSLNQTQNRISTGLKIGEAKDNAAYWSISTTLKSDNKALSTVSDALNLGASTVDTAYQGLNNAKDVLDSIKSKLTAASQDGVDKSAVQGEIAELQKQLQSIASSSTFSGENWLSVNSALGGYSASKSVVSSFNRSASGAVSIGTINIDTSSFVLVDGSVTGEGILDAGKSGNTQLGGIQVGTDAGAATSAALTDADDFSYTAGTGGTAGTATLTSTITVDGRDFNLNLTETGFSTKENLRDSLNTLLAGYAVASLSTNKIVITSNTTGTSSTVTVAGTAFTENSGATGSPAFAGLTDTTALTAVAGTQEAAAVTMASFGGSTITLDANDTINFDIAVNGASAKTVNISRDTVTKALGAAADGVIANADQYVAVVNQGLKDAGVSGVRATNVGGAVKLTSTLEGATSNVTVSNISGSKGQSILSIDVTSATKAQLTTYINAVSAATNKVTSAAATLGAVASRIDLQKTFVANLMDTIDKGVSGLVDADMNEESTKLQALQVKQQLGVQALSIANQSAQNVLSLFRS